MPSHHRNKGLAPYELGTSIDGPSAGVTRYQVVITDVTPAESGFDTGVGVRCIAASQTLARGAVRSSFRLPRQSERAFCPASRNRRVPRIGSSVPASVADALQILSG
jgi:hypothetical protein